eukprot:10622432-Lingulodinium_polyedra.AAC.1
MRTPVVEYTVVLHWTLQWPLMNNLSLHPVVHNGLSWWLHWDILVLAVNNGLYWFLQWAILVSAIHNDPNWCLQSAILESAGGSLVGCTTGTILFSGLESTVGSTWESTMT